MNRNNVWRFVLVVLVVLWSFYELYPPEGKNLVQYFREHAVNTRDTVFSNVVARAQSLEKAMPQKPYDNLVEAIGTNDITRYFPMFEAKNEQDPTRYILNRLQREAAGRIRLGLDLQGGTSFLVKMDTSSLTNAADTSGELSQAVEVLRKRVDKFGVAEPVIQPEGSDRILVQLPGLSADDQQNAEIAIKKPAHLEFKLVHEDSQNLINQGTTMLPGYQLMTQVKVLPNGTKQIEKYLVKKKPEMEGGIKSAFVTRDTLGRPEISFTMDSASADTFGRITTDNVGRQLAIILDGELQTAPVIRNPITGGSGVIEGDYSQQEAFALQAVLENPLKTSLTIEASRLVDPTLGKDSIRSGIRAAIYGTLAVSVFMLVYYMIAGLVANIALICQYHHPGGRHVRLRHYLHSAGHRRAGADRRHGR